MSGYNCCQSVFTAYSDLFGLDRDTSLRLSCSFGAGMGGMREVCGTVSAMFMIAGLVCGNTDPADQAAKTENYETVRRMAAAFKAEHKTIICREILGLRAAEKSAAPSERTPEYYRKRPCVRMVATAARIIEDTFPELFSGEEEAGLPGADRHPDPDKEAFPGEQEIFSVYDDDGKPLGQMKRGQVHRLGLWHEVVHCWMYARQGDTIWLYFQQRAASKKDFPGFYDLSSTGHVGASEEHAQAVLREVREETGVKMDPERLVYAGQVQEELHEGDFFDREIGQVYLYEMDLPEFLPGEEVDRMIAVPIEEYEKKEFGGAPYIQGYTLEGEPVLIREEEWCRHNGEYERLVKPLLCGGSGLK